MKDHVSYCFGKITYRQQCYNHDYNDYIERAFEHHEFSCEFSNDPIVRMLNRTVDIETFYRRCGSYCGDHVIACV